MTTQEAAVVEIPSYIYAYIHTQKYRQILTRNLCDIHKSTCANMYIYSRVKTYACALSFSAVIHVYICRIYKNAYVRYTQRAYMRIYTRMWFTQCVYMQIYIHVCTHTCIRPQYLVLCGYICKFMPHRYAGTKNGYRVYIHTHIRSKFLVVTRALLHEQVLLVRGGGGGGCTLMESRYVNGGQAIWCVCRAAAVPQRPTGIYTYIYIYAYIHICIYAYIYIYVYLYIYTRMCILLRYMWVCMYMYICISPSYCVHRFTRAARWAMSHPKCTKAQILMKGESICTCNVHSNTQHWDLIVLKDR